MSHRLAFVVLVLSFAALAALYVWVRPAPEPLPASPPAASTASEPAAVVAAAQEFDFEIAKGKVSGPPSLAVHQGQRVRIRVRSDREDELHLHGYDLSAPLPAGEIVTLGFIADRGGRFELELHHAQLQLGALEVQPD